MQHLIALIVDDDIDFREALAEVLTAEGYRAVEAVNGYDAITVLNALKPDVILIDLMMPVMNGWSLFAAIEARQELQNVPVVFLSAVSHMAPGGGSLVLKKPLNLPELWTLLDGLRVDPVSSEIRLKASPRTSPDYCIPSRRPSRA
jgi:CheY-like chemotaxis protein